MQDHSSRRAIFAISLSMAAYVVGDVVLKLLGRGFPPSELIFWRSAVIHSFPRRRPRLDAATAALHGYVFQSGASALRVRLHKYYILHHCRHAHAASRSFMRSFRYRRF